MTRTICFSFSYAMIAAALLLNDPACAFQLLISNGNAVRWPSSSASFDVGIDGSPGAPEAPAGETWNNAFLQALQRWNDATLFTWSIDRSSYRNPCLEDNDNGVGFSATACGPRFGSSTLAVTYQLFFVGGPFIETDIVFNNAETWRIYAGPEQGSVIDFRRVATHEIGHALGLDHEDSVEALMNTFVSDLEFPQADDIAGAAALYGRCTPTIVDLLSNSLTSGILDSNDCTLADLPGNSGDASLVDLYRVTLATGGLLTVAMRSADVDSFIWLFNSDLSTLIASDDDSGGNLDALTTQRLAAGTYVILANTASTQPEFGSYTLRLSFGPTNASAVIPIILLILDDE